jgi:hypothetical protein
MTLHLQSAAPAVSPGCMQFPLLMLEGSRLLFAESRDGEYVNLRLLSGRAIVDLGDRVHNVLLLALARERRGDEARGLPDTSCGWLYADQLADELGVSLPQLNLYAFRARRLLSSRGVIDADQVVERRRSTGQLRIGARQLEIQEL